MASIWCGVPLTMFNIGNTVILPAVQEVSQSHTVCDFLLFTEFPEQLVIVVRKQVY